MAEPLRTNNARLLERFMRSIEGAGYGGMSNYETARLAAEKLASDIELAYGLLWLGADGVSENPDRHKRPGFDLLCWNIARKTLLEHLDKAGQARGIEAARSLTAGDDP